MAKYQYGCQKAEIGTFNPSTGAVSAWKEIDIYQDTITLEQPEASRTDHFKQGDPAPKVSRFARVVKTVAFSIMDMSAESKAEWLGGTVTTVDQKDTWNAPKTQVNSTVKALRFTLEDGSVMTIPHTDCAGRLATNLNDTDIGLIPVVATIKSTGVEAVAEMAWTDQ
ncbi:hypothetical protein [Sphingobacterium psychroaquaticum]|uniref:Phage tail tube protein n=1 Tax=Sphingobacterium psychroaquaticum TaxID=561061 RepID=A0A1X7K3T4_9SPHI|nr:hypothetical protein [Sphingobacterium psychroaquaticum]SMG35394.1 hypothetical protein SAMN05660862_2520 [Sphingobacterium psychroaquaticum]